MSKPYILDNGRPITLEWNQEELPTQETKLEKFISSPFLCFAAILGPIIFFRLLFSGFTFLFR